MKKKNWYNSRTIWIAVITGLIGITVAVQGEYPDTGIFVTAIGVLNFVLRFLTTQPIK